jgi:hypothetical protein
MRTLLPRRGAWTPNKRSAAFATDTTNNNTRACSEERSLLLRFHTPHHNTFMMRSPLMLTPCSLEAA